ncbi:MAG TPA: glycoside hydrolase family 2 TIM barrel-domain containing protein, partial [Sphingomicrobium sp.]|nr:glycoside hydrolase family 2 TIM barrel-domain containing protein [Sphingomicrobium sp.]
MIDGLTRREMLGAGGVALAVSALPGRSAAASARDAGPRVRERLAAWRFHLGHAADIEKDFGFGLDQRTFAKAGQSALAASPKFDDSGWAEVVVPHDWAVGLPFAEGRAIKDSDRGAAHGFKAIGREFPENSIGWYRTPINVTAADKGRRIWLEFDGVFRDSIVFVNGYDVVRNESGYAPFAVAIDDFLDYDGGPNVVTVRCDATLGEGWFYEGAGIYRHVELVRADPLRIAQWGLVVRSELADGGANVRVSTEVINGGGARDAFLRLAILGPDGRTVALGDPFPFRLKEGEERTIEQQLRLEAPRPWSLEEPHLYTLRAELLSEGRQVIDNDDVRFGIRTIQFDPERGFFLNGKAVKLLGTCNHQDHAGVGTGIPDELHRWRIAQLQEMGSNSWRSAHNPPASVLLDACDEMGMLMICEQRINSSSPEAIFELERMVRRDRNHPSVILWSLGNEEPHQASERGARINAALKERVRMLDPTRLATFAMD